MHYHLAQVNAPRLPSPLDSPQLAAGLEAANAGADRAPGFVWRLHDASPFHCLDLSVWASLEDLKRHADTAARAEAVRAQSDLAMWWIPAGHLPTFDEAVERLDYRRAHGDSEAAFSFAKPFPIPDAPASNPVALPIDLDGRIFVTASNTANGDAGEATRFEYRQNGARVWATYRGGRVRFGALVAVGDPQGRLDMRYQHVGTNGAVRTGKCLSVPELLPDGRVRLIEQWQWTNGDRSSGSSIVEEIARG